MGNSSSTERTSTPEAVATHLGSMFCIPFASSPPASSNESSASTAYSNAMEDHDDIDSSSAIENQENEGEDEESEGSDRYEEAVPTLGDHEGGDVHDSAIWEGDQTNDTSYRYDQHVHSDEHVLNEDFSEDDDLETPEDDDAEADQPFEETNDHDDDDAIQMASDDSYVSNEEEVEAEGAFIQITQGSNHLEWIESSEEAFPSEGFDCVQGDDDLDAGSSRRCIPGNLMPMMNNCLYQDPESFDRAILTGTKSIHSTTVTNLSERYFRSEIIQSKTNTQSEIPKKIVDTAFHNKQQRRSSFGSQKREVEPSMDTTKGRSIFDSIDNHKQAPQSESDPRDQCSKKTTTKKGNLQNTPSPVARKTDKRKRSPRFLFLDDSDEEYVSSYTIPEVVTNLNRAGRSKKKRQKKQGHSYLLDRYPEAKHIAVKLGHPLFLPPL